MLPSRRRHRAMATTAMVLAAGLALQGLTAASSPASGPSYNEPYRPQFHFTLPQSWLGDPNGLVYRDGRYYLYSYGTWQGAMSTDLVHWQDIPVTGPQADPGSAAFYSGSAVVDKDNTSGFGTPGNPPMVAMYTSQMASGDQTQSLAYSTDQGKTWTRYAGNPVLDLHSQNFRDPKVFWYAPTHSWMMVIALSDQHKVAFYRSPDLKNWTHLSDFGPSGSTTGVWEMPDLYQLPVDGNPNNTKWVLSVSVGSTGVQYIVGQFDGTTFTPDEPATYTPPTGTPLDTFESGSYGNWTATGTAFGAAPATGTLPNQQTVSGFPGNYLLNSYNGGDGATGTLSSPAFTISKPHLNFLVGGGNHPYLGDTVPFGTLPAGQVFEDFSGTTYGTGWTATGSFATSGPSTESLPNQLGPKALDTWAPDGDPGTGTITSPTFTVNSPYIDLQVAGGNHPWGQADPTAVNLIIGGKVVATTTGSNSPELTWTNWDVSKYQGQQAQIQVVDQNDGSTGWGHLMVGYIVFADAPAKPFDTHTSVNLVVNGQVVRSTTGADSENLDWTSWDLSDLIGQQAQIQVVDHNTGGWGHILADDFNLSDAPALNANQRAHWVDYGADFYAFNTWNNTPDGQRIGIAWMSNWDYAGQVPTTPWKGAETFPRALSLQTIGGKVQLVQQPVGALSTLRDGPAFNAKDVTASKSTTPLSATGETLDLTAHLTAGTATKFGLNVRAGNGQYTQIGYDTRTGQLYIDRTHSGNAGFSPSFPGVKTAPLALDHRGVTLRILVDASSVEVYADQGHVTLTDQIFPDATSTGVSLFADGGTATLDNLQGWRLKSIWNLRRATSPPNS
jgi:fructan beta-fructosidase